MRNHRFALVLVLLLLGIVVVTGVAMGAEGPSPVSPGERRGIARIGESCPTFSWDPVPDARAHELAVYSVERGRAVADARPLFQQRLPGSASSWTPSLERCLERGETYAWSVRAVSGRGRGEWSEARVFQVRSAPTEAEFENALALVRRYLEERGGAAEAVDTTAAGAAAAATEELVVDDGSGGGMNRGASEFSVDGAGNVSGSSFTGDGSGLTNVDAELLDGLDSTYFAEGTHMHTPDEISTGSEFVLVSPIETATCVGSLGTTSTCSTTDCINGVRVGGGCVFHADTTCAEAGRAVTATGPSGTQGWGCNVVCNDGSGMVKAEGFVFCPVQATTP